MLPVFNLKNPFHNMEKLYIYDSRSLLILHI